MNRNKLKKMHYIGKTYKIQEIMWEGQLMYVVARNDNKKLFTAYTDLEKAKELWRKMEKEL